MFLCQLVNWIKNKFNRQEINQLTVIKGRVSLLDGQGKIVGEYHSTSSDLEVRDCAERSAGGNRKITNVKEIRFPPIALTSETDVVNVSTQTKVYGFDSEGNWGLREMRSQIQPIVKEYAKPNCAHPSPRELNRGFVANAENKSNLVSPNSSPSLSANAKARLKAFFEQGCLQINNDETLRNELSKMTWGGVVPQENQQRGANDFIELPRSQPIQCDCDTIVGGASNIPIVSWDWGTFPQTQERVDRLRSHITSVPSPENTKHLTIELRSGEPMSDSDTIAGGDDWVRSEEEGDGGVYRPISSKELANEIISQLLTHSPIPLPEETRIHLARINSNPDGSETIERFSLPAPLKAEIIPDRIPTTRSCSSCDFLRGLHGGEMACLAMNGRTAVYPFDKPNDCHDWEPIDHCDHSSRNRATAKRVVHVEKQSSTD